MHTKRYRVHKQGRASNTEQSVSRRRAAASIHIERRQLFILYVKLNFHETRLNFSQSAQTGLVGTNLCNFIQNLHGYICVKIVFCLEPGRGYFKYNTKLFQLYLSSSKLRIKKIRDRSFRDKKLHNKYSLRSVPKSKPQQSETASDHGRAAAS